MLILAATVGLYAHGFSDFPGLRHPDRVIQAIIDKGLIFELIIRCDAGEGIISYSKADRVFCGPDWRCAPTIAPVVERLCGT